MMLVAWYRLTFCFLALALAGCATTQPPQVQVTSSAAALPPQKVPVLVPCLTRDKVPPPPSTWLRTGQSREKMEVAAAADLKELDTYVVKTQSLMWACVEALEEKMP